MVTTEQCAEASCVPEKTYSFISCNSWYSSLIWLVIQIFHLFYEFRLRSDAVYNAWTVPSISHKHLFVVNESQVLNADPSPSYQFSKKTASYIRAYFCGKAKGRRFTHQQKEEIVL